MLARRHYGLKPAHGEPFEHPLVDIERITRLRAIAGDPYHKTVFGNLSTSEMMRVCALHLIENRDFRRAASVRSISFSTVAAKAKARPRETSARTSEASEPEPLTPYQAHMRSLSDRELARQLQATRSTGRARR